MVYLPHWPIPSSFGGRKVDFNTVFERIGEVLERLGNPQDQLPPIIHIAGTNGKGSTSSLVARIMQAHNYKTHLFTSPHLHHCNERIQLFGNPISDSELYLTMEEVRLACEDTPLSMMESLTVAAILAFKKNPADILVIECGMGGRLDATNILQNKAACAITSVSFDHEEYLGDNLAKIALEKVMIIRPNVPLIVSLVGEEAENVIKIIADDQNCPICFYQKYEEFSSELTPNSLSKNPALTSQNQAKFNKETDNFFSYKINPEKDDSGNPASFNFIFNGELVYQNLPKPALLGNHQYQNFSCAIAICEMIKKQFPTNQEGISRAILSVKWPSRIEKISGNFSKFFGEEKVEIWIDGAHNEDGARVLGLWLKENWQKENSFIIFGFTKDKCRTAFLQHFAEFKNLYCVSVKGEPRPEKSEKIAEIGEKIGLKITSCEDLSDAISAIAEKTKQQNQKDAIKKIMICGSLHLARDVRTYL